MNKKTNKLTLQMMLEKVLDEKEIAKTRERIIKSVKERRVKNED